MKGSLIVGMLLASAMAGFMVSVAVHGPQLKNNNGLVDEAVVRNTYHNPISFVAQIKNDPKAGEKIVHEFCGACHEKIPAIEVGAPRIGIAQEWAPYKKLTKEELLKSTKQGLGAMPARGGCFECSDEQLQQAIDYMLNF